MWKCRWNFWATQFRCILVFSILFRHEKFSSSCITPKPPLYEEAITLYKISFPHHEQREQASQCEILKNTDYHFEVICDEGCLIGKILYWCIEKLRYIEHFCILPSMRNQYYGQKILVALQERPLVLQIDPPVDEIAQRRKGFYECCGFVENPYVHVPPLITPNTKDTSLWS